MGQKPTTAGYAERLTIARERGPRPLSVRRLHEALQDRFPDLRGTSYGGVRHYAEGKVSTPRVDLLRAMAEVLDVRPDWLAFGELPMTEEEARLAAAQEGGELERQQAAHRRELWDAFTRGFPPFGSIGDLARTAIVEVWSRIAAHADSYGYTRARPVERPELPGVWNLAGPEHDMERAEAVGRLFMAPFAALHLDPTTLRARDRYVVLQAQALLTLIRDRTRGEEGASFSVDNQPSPAAKEARHA